MRNQRGSKARRRVGGFGLAEERGDYSLEFLGDMSAIEARDTRCRFVDPKAQ